MLVAASALAERIDGVTIASGLGLLTNREHLEGASVSNRALLSLARKGGLVARLPLAVPYLVTRLSPATHKPRGDDDRLGVLMREMRETFSQGTGGLARDLSTACRLEQVDLAAVKQRVMAWHGTGDRHAPLAAMRALIGRMPNASLHVVEGADHFLFESHAELILAGLHRSD